MKIRLILFTNQKSFYIFIPFFVVFILSFSCQKPVKGVDNIVLIVVDALRADHLGSYGYSRQTTPHIDRLAEHALVCSRAFSQSNWTSPSMASLFTGTYVFVHKVYNPLHAVNQDYSVLPDNLTIIPQALGEGFFKYAITSLGWVSPEANYKGFDLFAKTRRNDRVIINRAIRWLKQDKPDQFFLYLHLLDLHDYFWMKRDFEPFMQDSYDLSPWLEECHEKKPDDIYRQLQRIHSKEELTQADLDYLIDRYDSHLFRTDQLIGELVSTLEDQGLLEKTLIFLTADHGEKFFEHNELMHGGQNLYNEVVQIPLIVHNKKIFKKPRSLTYPVESIDIFPTIVDIFDLDDVRIQNLPQLQGNSLLRKNEDKTAMIENSQRSRIKIVNRNWSYIYHIKRKKGELYDLDADPLEQNDVSGDYPQVVEKMNGLLSGKLFDSQRLGEMVNAKKSKMDEEMVETMKSLGYIK